VKLVSLLVLLFAPAVFGQEVSFSLSAPVVEAYDFIEITAHVSPGSKDCYRAGEFSGFFKRAGRSSGVEQNATAVQGFCDAEDGSVYRIRFMPDAPGEYTYEVNLHGVAATQGAGSATSLGRFRVTDGHRRGPIRVDPQYPWHFIWQGTGEHYFFNGTTAYWIMGWKDERVIRSSIDRLHRLKVNRMRVALSGRSPTMYGEPAMNGDEWSLWLAPFAGKAPSDISHPDFDWNHPNFAYWQKYDRMLRYARDRDVVMSLVLDMGDNPAHLPAGSAEETQYIRYAVNRFAAFSNITWDLGDDLDHFRDEQWTHATGTMIKAADPYKHLATSHPVDNLHQDRTADWFDFTSFQEWSRDQHRFMLSQRKKQQELGRSIPQANEEYGYEDHYPLWAVGPGSESADVLRRTAWDIYMAGGYQTAGETVRRGTNIWPDSGGGWMNGRGDDTMTMFLGYGHIVEFFTSFDWWKTEPHDEWADNGNYCLSQPGVLYAVYLPKGGKVTLQLPSGEFRARWFDPASGEWIPLDSPARGPAWTSPPAPSRGDWALLLTAP
jgi:Protein of unknown function (DUF4038)/Domain of unknown function (DUF5060)/Putative collagen-binding domain of a collagenase